VAQYLYLHEPGDRFYYPSSRSYGDASRLGVRYLECVLVQAASLRWSVPDCELVLVTNLTDRDSLTRRARRLLNRILSLGVKLVAADYHHAPRAPVSEFHASRYVLDAIDAVAARLDPDRQLWMVDVDCIWLDPPAAFATVAARRGIGALQIGYSLDWVNSGYSREDLGALGARFGDCTPAPTWIGGEVVAGEASELRRLVKLCDVLDQELERVDAFLPIEEQLFTLLGALGRQEFQSLSGVAGRIWTGRRHQAANPADPSELTLWHLPSEKGLSFRRAANALLHGEAPRLRRDLSSRERAMTRFNVSGVRWSRSLRDDTWIVATRLRDAVLRSH
jgi:hypothetical protein